MNMFNRISTIVPMKMIRFGKIYMTTVGICTSMGSAVGLITSYEVAKNDPYIAKLIASIGGSCVGAYCGMLFGIVSPISIPVTIYVTASDIIWPNKTYEPEFMPIFMKYLRKDNK
jgi:hypothetical protein